MAAHFGLFEETGASEGNSCKLDTERTRTVPSRILKTKELLALR